MSDLPSSSSPPLDSIPEALRDLADRYFFGELTEAQLGELESILKSDPVARRFFARYAMLHRDLGIESHARKQADTALLKLGLSLEVDANRDREPSRFAGGNFGNSSGAEETDRPRGGASGPSYSRFRSRGLRWFAAAAAIALAAGAGWWIATARDAANIARSNPGSRPAITPISLPDVAWLVNAQNCQWADETAPSDLRPGTLLRIERGLAEVKFRSGAIVLLEGPARLELLSENSARLHRGRLAGKVAGPIKGFELFSPKGKIIDLGTEFGVSVADGGQTDVYVFKGKVQAVGQADGKVIDLSGTESARIDTLGNARRDNRLTDAETFVRDIIPPPLIEPRTLRLNFDKGYDGTLADANGLGTGLTHRLPGTGGKLGESDPNLSVNTEDGRLELTTTDPDINNQAHLEVGEYLGVRLADLGFTGPEDFEVEMVVPNIPALRNIGQFGLYAGSKSDKVIRGGLISRGKEGPYTLFMTNNNGGADHDSHALGMVATGDDVRFRLKRTNGKYTLAVENLNTASTSTIAIRHPAFLDPENDLYVGFFGANTRSEVRRTLVIKEFAVTVWTTRGKAE